MNIYIVGGRVLDNVEDTLPQEEVTEELYNELLKYEKNAKQTNFGDTGLTKIDTENGTQHTYKQPVSFLTIFTPIITWGVLLFFWIFTRHPFVPFLLILSVIGSIPFILNREIRIDNNGFHISFGFSEDNIPLNNIESIKYVGRKPLMISGIDG